MRTLDGWGTILSFHVVVEAGLPAATVRYEQAARAVMLGNLSGSDIFEGAALPDEMVEALVQGLSGHTTKTAVASVDAASFVFMHSLLDALTFDLCRISALKDPDRWADLVKTRRISVEQIRLAATYDGVLRDVLEVYLGQLEREALLKKIDLIFRACAPARVSGTRADGSVYVFDRGRMNGLTSYATTSMAMHLGGRSRTRTMTCNT